jgi:putative flippase GtrA
MKSPFSSLWLRQATSYLAVGGTAAVMEWGAYYLFNHVLGVHYLLSTALSFVLSTYVNYIMGKTLTFRHNGAGLTKGKEISAIYLVSAAGLLMNLAFMYVFVALFGFPGIVSKIAATGIVFVWNFLLRKFVIYKV